MDNIQVLARGELPPEVSGEGLPEGGQGLSGPHQVLRLKYGAWHSSSSVKCRFTSFKHCD